MNTPSKGPDQPKTPATSPIRTQISKWVLPALLAMKLGTAGCAATAADTGNMAHADDTPVATPTPTDAAFESSDAGSMAVDAGPIVIPTPTDAGVEESDAGSMGADA